MPRWLNTPITLPLTALALGLLMAAITVALTLGQPWMGLRLAASPEGTAVVITAVAPTGPAAQAGAQPGAVLVALNGISLEADDLIEEPDMIESFDAFARFIARQDRLAQQLQGGGSILIALDEDEARALHPARLRPLQTLPAAFWAQVLVGLFGFVAGSWVLGLRRSRAAAFLWLAGVGLLLSAHAAAIYSARELALPGAQFQMLSSLNHLGALGFGAGMIGLFLCYPVRLVPSRWQFLPGIALLVWWGANQFRLLPTPALGFQLPVALALAAIAVCVALQYRATRTDPRARAALRWLGLAVLIGAGAFVMTIIVPILLGFDAPLSQGFAFLFFLPIYAGLALGVARYRLFELEDWAFRILFYLAGMVMLLVLDASLIALIAMDRAPAFGLSLLAVSLLYLPLRDDIGRRLLRRRNDVSGQMFRAITDVALTPPDTSRIERWQALLTASFDPLRIEPMAETPPHVRLAEEGSVLEIPAVDTLPPQRLVWARGGRALYSPHDLARAEEMVTMLDQAAASRRAYEMGAAEERARIAQDMHDNIGIQLTGALHSGSAARKDALIRETLSDLRDIISNANRADLELEELLADLRATMGEHLSSVGIALDWKVAGAGPSRSEPRQAHALRSILREAVSNALRHSGASQVRVRVWISPDAVHVSVEDNGRGIGDAIPQPGGGNGLSNMRARANGMGGEVIITEIPGGGTRVEAVLPMASAGKAA